MKANDNFIPFLDAQTVTRMHTVSLSSAHTVHMSAVAEGRALRHETCHFGCPQVTQCPLSVGNAPWCCFWCTGSVPAGASSAHCAIQTAHVQGGFHPEVPHLALLPANKSTEWTPDSLATAFLCNLLSRETLPAMLSISLFFPHWRGSWKLWER